MLRFGSKCYYGLLAVGELVESWVRREPIQVKDIARRQSIPEDYLGQIMVVLRKANIVEAFRGPGGGYLLARSPELISVAEVLEALEGAIAEKDLGERSRKGPKTEVAQNILRVWHEAAQLSTNLLRSTPVSTIAARGEKEPMFYI